MPSWYDLPLEVKYTIFGFVLSTEDIVYHPLDRRFKNDIRYNNAYHVHNLLRVSKSFLTSDEFAFIRLRNSRLKFYNFNQLRRVVAEVKPEFKENVNHLHFFRTFVDNSLLHFKDDFDRIGNLHKLFSQNFPNLKTITISQPDLCIRLPHDGPRPGLNFKNITTYSKILHHAFSLEPRALQGRVSNLHAPHVPYALAGVVGNRDTRDGMSPFLKPYAWLHKLITYAEKVGIELIFNVPLCIYPGPTNVHPTLTSQPLNCYRKNRVSHFGDTRVDGQVVHFDAHVTSKDWILKLDFDDQEFRSDQGLGRDFMRKRLSPQLLRQTRILNPSQLIM